LAHLEIYHGIEIDPRCCEKILSINVARNCLVHRGGTVTEKDTNTSNVLEVKWTKLLMFLMNEDGEKELVLGQIVEKDSVLGIRNQEQTKVFALGEQLKFSTEEFANIAWGLFLFGNDLVKKISRAGKEKGFVNPVS